MFHFVALFAAAAFVPAVVSLDCVEDACDALEFKGVSLMQSKIDLQKQQEMSTEELRAEEEDFILRARDSTRKAELYSRQANVLMQLREVDKSIVETRAKAQVFDPWSPLVSYTDENCGKRGFNAVADMLICPNGALPVIEKKTVDMEPVAIIDNCKYWSYTVYECLGPSAVVLAGSGSVEANREAELDLDEQLKPVVYATPAESEEADFEQPEETRSGTVEAKREAVLDEQLTPVVSATPVDSPEAEAVEENFLPEAFGGQVAKMIKKFMTVG